MSATQLSELRQPLLSDRYALDSGRALMNGTQALVRLLLEQRRLDTRRGLNTGLFISGYPGSPLGGLDMEIARAKQYLEPAGVVHVPGLNEELAATAVGGTQLLGELPGRRQDGVVGIWYGKGPGLDRAADAIRHGMVSGTHHLGGAVALIGDDPLCKSSTIASSSEAMCRSLVMPMLAPGDLPDLIRLGLHAVAMSRYTGMWTAVKIISDVADSSEIVELDGLCHGIPEPPTQSRGAPPVLLGPSSLDGEHDLFTLRLDRAREYARINCLNRVTHDPPRARIAVMAAGLQYATLLRALGALGIDSEGLDALGIRLVALDMPWPVDREVMRDLLRDVQEVFVIEDKLPFLETLVRDALYGIASQPSVVGKEDPDGKDLLTSRGSLDADTIAIALASRIGVERLSPNSQARLARIRQATQNALALEPLHRRTPFFCSGCPHNTSTKAPADQLVGAGIGCHSLVALDPGGQRGHLVGAPQMGGEGAQWIGLSPFTDDDNYIQNMGDGTFHHSGSLAIRAAVASATDITFKILYNDAIAMTGGQAPPGRMDVPTLTRWLAIEGVAQIVVTADDPKRYDSIALDPIATLFHRDDFDQARATLIGKSGVCVLIHDDRCAVEERRMRKRGKLPSPKQRVWINERVCEGCGDCGTKSTCMSVVPVHSEFGRKTQIHQASCNQDFSCLEGDCPAFVVVEPGATMAPTIIDPQMDLPEPMTRLLGGDSEETVIRMPGVGGTGVVTSSAILQMAALIDGRWAGALDQTGLAQKGGPVISDIRIADRRIGGALRATTAAVDVILGLDPLGAATAETLATADPDRTIAVVNSNSMATAATVVVVTVGLPSHKTITGRIASATRADQLIEIDAGDLAQRLFADHMAINTIMLGAAYQHGCLPLRAEAIEAAIKLNGTAVESNLAAFRWGRAAVADPVAVEQALSKGSPTVGRALDAKITKLVEAVGGDQVLEELLAIRASDLVTYQDRAYAERYLADVSRVAVIERERGCGATMSVTKSYARGLYKLMAYKDEYEVARLHADAAKSKEIAAVFGDGAKTKVLLHPPLLRALGLKRKIKLGRSADISFSLLRRMRRVRGTALDPFGYTSLRRVERSLIGEYQELVGAALEELTPESQPLVSEIADLAQMVRGYEEIKLANIELFRASASEKRSALTAAR